MNILFLSHRVPYPPNKGEKIRTFHQIEYLKHAGHNIIVICPLENDQDQDYCIQLSKVLNIECHGIKIGNRKLKMLSGLISGKALSVANFYDKKLQSFIDSKIKDIKLDSVICTASSMAEYILKSTSINTTQASLLMDFMDLDSDKWRQYAERSSFIKKWIYQREQKILTSYERLIEEKFDTCLFISDIEVDLFCQKSSKKHNVHAIANGIDTLFFKPNPHRDYQTSPCLLFTGVMDYLPNVDAVVWFVETIWPKIIKQHPQAKFYIAGMNPNEKVKTLAKQPGIVVTGFVEDILPYYDQATLFVAPFRIARGVQNKVLQAMACGLPVVTTPSGGEGIEYTESEDLLIADNEQAIFEKITHCINNPQKAENIGKNAAKLIQQNYSWSGKLSRLETFIMNKSNQR